MMQEEEKLKGLYRETALKSRCLLRQPAAREPLAAMAVWRRVRSALRYGIDGCMGNPVTGKLTLRHG